MHIGGVEDEHFWPFDYGLNGINLTAIRRSGSCVILCYHYHGYTCCLCMYTHSRYMDMHVGYHVIHIRHQAILRQVVAGLDVFGTRGFSCFLVFVEVMVVFNGL